VPHLRKSVRCVVEVVNSKLRTFNIEGLTEDGLRRPLQPEAFCLPLQRRTASPRILLKVRCVVLPPPQDANGPIVGIGWL
jgi:hypothetical protein